MNGKFLLLGSNIGDRLRQLNKACKVLQKSEVRILAHSSIYETAPWGIADQEWFLNIVLKISTPMNPDDLLEVCMGAEKELGREREIKWGPRIIDIDILYYDNKIIHSDKLDVPHPGIPERRFTLLPLNEMIPQEIHPSLQKTQAELLKVCPDQSSCRITNYHLDLDLA